MGTLVYGSADGYDFDDRVLAHLQAVIATKHRRQQGFLLIWVDRTSSAIGTLRSIWIDRSISLQFVFNARSIPALNREWVAEMAEKANSNGGFLFEDDLRAKIREEASNS